MSTSTESGEKEQEHVSVRVNDPELLEVLRNGESKSDVVRRALATLAEKQGVELNRDDLDREQVEAWVYLRDRVGSVGGTLVLDVAETELAQLLQKKKKLVRVQVTKPLQRAGYIDVTPAMEWVRLTVRNPRGEGGE